MLNEVQDPREMITDDGAVPNQCHFLVSRMEKYYSLALLLTASETNAAKCFILALDRWSTNYLNRAPITEEVADVFFRRALVDCALRLCLPHSGQTQVKFTFDVPGRKLPGTWSPWLARRKNCVKVATSKSFSRFLLR